MARTCGLPWVPDLSRAPETGLEDVPRAPGVYVVLRESDVDPVYLGVSLGGWFKKKDPTVDVEVLRGRWVEGTGVIYIGKGDVLRRRLKEFSDFGSGRPVGHWGGRYTWQIDGSEEFVVAWTETPGEDPRVVEVALLAQFRSLYGRQPIANIA